MDQIETLLEWAPKKGVQIRGVKPRPKANCGIVMIATKNLKKGDVLVMVPDGAMQGLATVPLAIREKLPKMSIHALLAATFVLNPPEEGWKNVIPTEFNAVPFFWPPAAQKLLPGAAKRLLNKQQGKCSQDWGQLKCRYPAIAREAYEHAWFVVSTRAFYQETEQTLRYPSHDRLALLPVADLFNHAAAGCTVQYDAEGYEIIADREYLNGDEVRLSYGKHSNDFLLAEYGFILPNNKYDRFDPEELILPECNAEKTTLLRQLKTSAALRQVCGPATEEEHLRDNEEFCDEASETDDTGRLREFLHEWLDKIKRHRQKISSLGDGSQVYQTLLLQRWNQIDELVRKAMQLSTSEGGSVNNMSQALIDSVFS